MLIVATIGRDNIGPAYVLYIIPMYIYIDIFIYTAREKDTETYILWMCVHLYADRGRRFRHTCMHACMRLCMQVLVYLLVDIGGGRDRCLQRCKCAIYIHTCMHACKHT